MSNSKIITELAAYTDSQVQSDDLLFITDIAAQETKKITSIDLADYVISAKSASIFNGNYTGSFTGSLFGTSSWANKSISSSFADNSITASYALVSSADLSAINGTNVGSYGQGVFKQKSGDTFQFKRIGQGDNIIVSTDPSDSDVITITANIGTTPGGSTGQVQFVSNANTFDGNSNFVWDVNNNNKLTVIGGINSTSFTSSLSNQVGFLGTSSYSISSSNSITSSYALSSSYTLSSSYATTASYVLNATSGGVKAIWKGRLFTSNFYSSGNGYTVTPIYCTGFSSPKSEYIGSNNTTIQFTFNTNAVNANYIVVVQSTGTTIATVNEPTVLSPSGFTLSVTGWLPTSNVTYGTFIVTVYDLPNEKV
jgi:hypothetical protein